MFLFFWGGGIFDSGGGFPPPRRCLDKTLVVGTGQVGMAAAFALVNQVGGAGMGRPGVVIHISRGL